MIAIKRMLLLCSILLSFSNVNAQEYVFFLHNKFVELEGLNGMHPEYGKVEYKEILQSLKKEGFVVFSEVRAKNTDGNVYAIKIAKQVDSLLSKGIKPSSITVIGTSKGGFIAMYVSGLVRNKDVNYVFIGCCGDESRDDKDIVIYGNILSIYERSDMTSSCRQTINKKDAQVNKFKEIELNTGLKHGFLYKALPEWLTPATKWAKQQYYSIDKP